MQHRNPSKAMSSLLSLLTTAALTLVCNPAFASGSDGGGSAETGDTAAYNMGKSVYAAKFACSSCPLAGKRLDAAMAKEILAKKPEVSMSAEEMQALTVYLKRRFEL